MSRKHLLIAAAALLIACWNSVGFHQGDEHFQLLEFAAWKLGLLGQEDLAWEFAERMRPATQPAIVYVFYKAWSVFGEVNPYHFTFFLRLLSAAGFLLLAVKLWERYESTIPTPRLAKWLALGLLFNWCSVYSGIRFSGENWAGMALAAGFLLYPMGALAGWDRRHEPPPTPPHGGGLLKTLRVSPTSQRIFSPGREGRTFAAFAAGFLFGLAFLFRYQVAIMVVGFGAWLLFIRRDSWQRISLVVLGGLAALAVGTLLDRWFYEEWVIAPWHYLRSNLIEGKAATFGSAPWWDYFRMVFERGVPPLGLLYIIAPLWFAWRYRRDPITWMMVPFLLVHFVLSRKDARFLFPLLPYLPVMIMAGIVALRKHYGEGFPDRKWVSRSIKVLWGMNLVILATVLVRPMISEVKVNKFVYDNYTEPVTLFADNKHIYTYANLTMNFYQRPGKVTIFHTESREAWPDCTTPVCLYSRHAKVAAPPEGAKLVYTTRPIWADELGLKDWLDGMKWWTIWELAR